MSLYQLEQQDIKDLLDLIMSDALPIKASRAARVFQLQVLLSKVEPVSALDVERLRNDLAEAESRADAANEALAKQITTRQEAVIAGRDVMLAFASIEQLEAELALRRVTSPT